MKLSKAYLIIILIIAIECSCYAQSKTFAVFNPLNIERTKELVVLKRADIEKLLGKINEDFHLEISPGNKEIKYQTEDLNDDNNWDQLVFLSSFKPKEKKIFTIKSVVNKKFVAEDTAQPLAHVRLKPKSTDSSFGESVTNATMPYQNAPTDFSKQSLPYYLTEGPAWENDKTAFRLYFDTRNTKDIYGKRISGMVMDTVGANPANSYHDLSNWGMDILHVAKSLGAGSLAIKTKDKNGNDTLIRLGGNNIQKETYQQLADGPLLASFQMNYQWQINEKPVTVTEQTSISGGQYFYESKVIVTDAPQGSDLVIGIADFYENTADSFHTNKAAVLLSHGKQSENKDELGMAVMLQQQGFTGFSEAPKINSDVMDSHLAVRKIINGKPIIFRFYSCWSKTDKRFASQDYFKNFINDETQKFDEPLIINWAISNDP